MSEKKQKHPAARKKIPPERGRKKTHEENFCGKLLKKMPPQNPVGKPSNLPDSYIGHHILPVFEKDPTLQATISMPAGSIPQD